MDDGGGQRASAAPGGRTVERTVERIVEPLAWGAAWSVVAVTGIVMATQGVGWSGTSAVAVLQALTPYLVAALAPLAVAAMWRRRLALGFTAGLIGLCGVLVAAPLVVPAGPRPPADGARGVRVAAVNLLYANERIGDAADVLVTQDADVIVFSEYTAAFQTALRGHQLADRYPFRIERDGRRAGGAAVWSRFPLGERATLATENFSIDTVVDGPDGPFVLVGVHPPAPLFDFGAWERDLAVVAERVGRATEPTLVIGDFNASYWHPPFRRLLDHGFADAHIAHGAGFSPSWPTDTWYPPFVRLDHALTGRGLVSTAVVDFDVPGSDHRGLVVTVAPAR